MTLLDPRHNSIVHRTPFYYGWVIMVIGTFGLIATSPGQTSSVSVFIEHIITDLGLSRSLVSTLYTIATLIGSLALPFVGRQFDKRGPRRTIALISLAFGCATIYMGFVRGPWLLLFGFIAIRMLGQGSLQLVSSNLINNWWVRRRGIILGVAGMLAGLVELGAFPALINGLIGLFGWRMTWVALGSALLLVFLPVSIAFVRNQPEEFGLEPDGGTGPQPPSKAATYAAEQNWTLAEARRTPVFWISAAGMATIAMLGTGQMFHNVSIFLDNGLDPALAAALFLPMAATTASVNLVSGILVGRVPVRYMLAVGLLFQGLALWMALYLVSVAAVWMYAVVIGVFHGMGRTTRFVLWPTYFGRKHLGSIAGVGTAFLIAGSALGPMPFGIARDLLGSYDLTFRVVSLAPFVLAALTIFVRPPRKADEIAVGLDNLHRR